jgi:LmbE family N-acetylglucosaminyl deacetylase
MSNEKSMVGKIILAVCAHPDDLEFGCGGTVAKWVKEGASAYYVVITDGTKGSEDMNISSEQLKEIRRTEQQAAAEILGVKEVFFLNYIDGELVNTPEVRHWIVRIIRQLKPDVVICQDPGFLYDLDRGFINHPDHRAAGQITLDCVFPFSRNARTFPELLEEDLTSHKVATVLLTSFGKANYFVDISDSIETKLEALAQHKSQQEDPAGTKAFVKERARAMGEKNGAQYAEGFQRIDIGR